MKKVFLHVGFHKTATTSFQDICIENKAKLLKQGFLYPKIKYHNRYLHNHGTIIESIFSNEPDKIYDNIIYGFKDIIKDVVSDAKKELELLLNTDVDNLILSGEAISCMKKNELLKLSDFFNSFGVELKVLCCVRSPYSFLCSILQQNVKVNTETLKNIEGRSKSQHALNLLDVFGDKIEFYSFSEACSDLNGPVGFLFKKIGLQTKYSIQGRKNVGLNNLSTRLYAYLNSFFPNVKSGRINPKGRGNKEKDFDNTSFILQENEINKVKQFLDKENDVFKSLFGEKFTDIKYKLTTNLKVSIVQAIDIYDFHGSDRLIALKVIDFILINKGFEVEKFLEVLYEKRDADYLRDLSFCLTGNNQLKAISYAILLRPDGPIIKERFRSLIKEL